MANFLEILEQDRGEKADGAEMLKAKNALPDHVTKAIPFCIIDDAGLWDVEALATLAWVRLLRDQPEATLDEIKAKLNMNNMREIAKEVVYAFGEFTREQIESLLAPVEMDLAIQQAEDARAARLERMTKPKPSEDANSVPLELMPKTKPSETPT